MADSDCIVIMGSNMAENHPVAFRWPMQAKAKGAKLIHVDPRFTRTSAVADIYAPIRAGSDIAFLGGLIHYVINSERWNNDPFFKEFVVNYTNAADDHQRRVPGHRRSRRRLFRAHAVQGRRNWPFNGFIGQYDDATWQYADTQVGDQGWRGGHRAVRRAVRRQSARQGQQPSQARRQRSSRRAAV